MQNLWNEAEAAACKGILGPRVYSSRLLGREKSLVLYGGGNTSLKAKPASADVLFVKGSGSDLARVEAADFVPLELEATRKVFGLATAQNSALSGAIGKCVIGTSPSPRHTTLPQPGREQPRQGQDRAPHPRAL